MSSGDKTLIEVIKDILDSKEIQDTLYNGDLKEDDVIIVNKRIRGDVKYRLLEYRCRKYIRINILNGDEETNSSNITSNEQQSIRQLVTLLSTQLNTVEVFYLNRIYKNTPSDMRIQIDEFKMKTKYKNDNLQYRRNILYQILFSLVAIYCGEEIDNILLNNDLKEKLKDNIERRLRIIERFRYFVGGDKDVKGRLVNSAFKYPPSGMRYSRIQGISPSLDLMKWVRISESISTEIDHYGCSDENNIKNSWWHQIHPEYKISVTTTFPAHKVGNLLDWKDFSLTECSKKNSSRIFRAITGILTIPIDPDSNEPLPSDVIQKFYTTYTYCDRVIHIVHLDELAVFLKKKNKENLLNDFGQNDRIAIINPWREESNFIGTGDQNDPLYERIYNLRFDEVIPGDNIVIINHPLYKGTRMGSWQLENAIVTDMQGITMPDDIEAKGLGIGPNLIRYIQQHLAKSIYYTYWISQGRLEGEFSDEKPIDEIDLIKKRDHEFQNKWNDKTAAPEAPFNIIVNEKSITKGIFKEKKKELGGLFANIEFRFEHATTGNNFIEEDKLAFFFRWIADYPFPNKDIEEIWNSKKKYKEWIYSLYRSKNEDDEIYDLLHKATASLYKLPFINEIKIDNSNKKLKLYGGNFSSNVIRSIYFVSYPRFYNIENESKNKYFFNHYRHPVEGEYEVQAVNIQFISDSELHVTLPDQDQGVLISTTPQDGTEILYWKPIIKISFFDPHNRLLMRDHLSPSLLNEFDELNNNQLTIEWYENLNDNEYKHIILKDSIASLQFEIRSEFAFQWPIIDDIGEVSIDIDSICNSRTDENNTPYIIGHPYFNMVYTPLYRKTKIGDSYGIKGIQPVPYLIPYDFYRGNQPYQTIRTTRPKFDPNLES